MKLEVVDSAASVSGVSNARTLLSASTVLGPSKRKSECGPLRIYPKNALKWDWDTMYQYMATGKMMFRDRGPLCLALDGVRIAGEETLQTVAWGPLVGRAVWLPIQVLYFSNSYL